MLQGQHLEITIVGCTHLKDTEFFSKQDPYVVLEYAGSRYRTKTDTDGGRHPNFNEKFTIPLVDGLAEFSVAVWNSNTFTSDDFIGSGKIQLQKALTDGYHDFSWPLMRKHGRRAGEIRIILHYEKPDAYAKPSVQREDTVFGKFSMPSPSPAHYAQSGRAELSTYPAPQIPAGGYHPYMTYPPCHSHGSHGYTCSSFYGTHGASPTYPPYGPHADSTVYPPLYPPNTYSSYSSLTGSPYHPSPY
ncbi:hypothetical protein KP509_24G074000 [Ceratopteris richardii]|uniref:C2 domain-containing protein n=1 Tax=Ceratopteris richardii TaxID=49495 RepID=A0A8T2RYN1_CERRI|nr:hypothetical protein KP509_24G074000 [Ceratopteris richardii]